MEVETEDPLLSDAEPLSRRSIYVMAIHGALWTHRQVPRRYTYIVFGGWGVIILLLFLINLV